MTCTVHHLFPLLTISVGRDLLTTLHAADNRLMIFLEKIPSKFRTRYCYISLMVCLDILGY